MAKAETEIAKWVEDFLMLPTRMKEVLKMGQKTDAAVTALENSVNEVAGEMQGLAAEIQRLVDAGTAVDQSTADRVQASADRLSGLQADPTPADPTPPADPAPVDPAPPVV